MNKTLLTILCYFSFLPFVGAQNTDLPNPTANLQTVPNGSYVIAMDNTLQVNSSGDFNLKAYGLIVHLLNNQIKIRWAIRAGKLKDDIDFTATAEQIKPTLSVEATRNFKAGPFIIFATDTTGVATLINAFYTANALTGTNRPQVYRLTADAANVDIRYDLSGFIPKAGVLTDGGNQNIHLAYMTACAIPAGNYSTSTGSNLSSNCFTFASEPHNSNSGTTVNNTITSIRDFVIHGGNFLAQCEAINNYENNTLGRFQTTSGITVSNTNIGTTLLYPNPDLSYCQFEGVYNASSGGSVKNWKIIGTPPSFEMDFATGTVANTNVIGASVAKLFYDKGGLVFYIGNHSFAATSIAGINGIRMYMNAFLTPTNTNCPSLLYTLPVKLLRFSGNSQNNKTILQWTISENESADHFEVERSTADDDYVKIGSVPASPKNGEELYSFSEPQLKTKSFYRLKMIGKDGRFRYSNILEITAFINNASLLTILTNPLEEQQNVNFKFESGEGGMISLRLYTPDGALCYTATLNIIPGINRFTINSNKLRVKGSYILEVTNRHNEQTRIKLLKL